MCRINIGPDRTMDHDELVKLKDYAEGRAAKAKTDTARTFWLSAARWAHECLSRPTPPAGPDSQHTQGIAPA